MLLKCTCFWHRFQKIDLDILRMALSLPVKYTCVQGTTATGMEALLLLLQRLNHPKRWCELVTLFGRSESEFSNTFKMVMLYIRT